MNGIRYTLNIYNAVLFGPLLFSMALSLLQYDLDYVAKPMLRREGIKTSVAVPGYKSNITLETFQAVSWKYIFCGFMQLPVHLPYLQCVWLV